VKIAITATRDVDIAGADPASAAGKPNDTNAKELSMKQKNVKTNPLRGAAIDLGLRERGERSVGGLPIDDYSAIFRALNDIPRKGRGLSDESARIMACALLSKELLWGITPSCVSEHIVSGTRWMQGKAYKPLPKELEMMARAKRLETLCAEHGLTFRWCLILADAWSLTLFPDRVDPERVTAYCSMMIRECQSRGLRAVRWTELMTEHQVLFDRACEGVSPLITSDLIRFEAFRGETSEDKHDDEAHKLRLAKMHILWRAAEAAVFMTEFGDCLVLSTESRKLQRYDNMLIPRSRYAGHDFMPKYPHRIDYQDR